MANQVSLCLVIHSHQPVGNFGGVIEDAFQRSYQPFLSVLARHPRIRLCLHYSGILLEWVEQHHPEFMSQLGEMTQRGQVEHLTGGYFEPILAAIPDAEKITQICRQSEFLRQRFARMPRGLWVAERVWEQGLIPPLVAAGVDYTILDDVHFLASGVEPSQLHQVYLTEEMGLPLKLIPSLQSLRYTIPFRDPQETLSILRGGLNRPNALFAVGDDGEKFGVWPETHEHCYADGWLESFFQALEGADGWLEVTTLSDYLGRHPPARRVYLPTSSYAEMMTWSLPTRAAMELEACLEETKTMHHADGFRRFLRGGQWRNFLSKYPESNQMQKLMLRACRRWHELRRVTAGGSEEEQLLAEAQNHLLAAQCNDAYWHGIFGGLYAPHLRSALLGHLIQTEALLDQIQQHSAHFGARVAVEDFDVDGHEEILIEHPAFGLIARPADGGTLSSLRCKKTCRELINSLMRRPEAYHKLVQQHLDQGAASGGAPASIHERMRSKEANLAALLHYDRYARHAFRVYLFPPHKNCADFEQLHLEECAELAEGLWKLAGSPRHSDAFELQQHAMACLGERPIRLHAAKAFTLQEDDCGWYAECHLKLAAENSDPMRCALGMEIVLNLLAPNSPGCYFHAGDARHPLEFKGELLAPRLALRDERERLEILLEAPSVARWWIAPVDTISQSESGFERVYQGSAIMAVWDVKLDSQKESDCALRMVVRSAA